MLKFSANYSYTNHNFVIQNLLGQRVENKYTSAICIMQNILQRGKPTIMSTFLQEKIGAIHDLEIFKKPYPLISNEKPKWERIIRGDEEHNYFPAQKFYEELIPKFCKDYSFIQQLLIPEVPIKDIINNCTKEFEKMQVDFYLPQAYLIIEIDGKQHELEQFKDKRRDDYTKKHGIKTIRILTEEIETENSTFLQKMLEIENRIKKIILSQNKRRENLEDVNNNTFIGLSDYKTAYESKIDIKNSVYISTSVMRIQILILKLLELDKLKFNKKWVLEIYSSDVVDFAETALEDLFVWFEHLFALHKIQFEKPQLEIIYHKDFSEFSTRLNTIKIDFSLTKRYTDEFQLYSDIIFVRTDYFDEYLKFSKGNSTDSLKFNAYEQYDYYTISTYKPVKYELKLGQKNSDERHLAYFAWNLFLQTNKNINFTNFSFREGQIPIIKNALERNDTIGLLPTGSGKSICYQLSVILQPAISFVVCPIISLMQDQKSDLNLSFFDRTNYISSDKDEEEKEQTMVDFSNGKYQFIFISPERFQNKKFREHFQKINKKSHIAYAVIDEVHCLSEWGHDFRTSYLQLTNTIRKICSNFRFMGLTATASLNVLKDIQVEFDIGQNNIMAPLNYSRDELEFHLIESTNRNATSLLVSRLKEINKEDDFLNLCGSDSKCGIIFTKNVNGKEGCYSLSNELSKHLNTDVKYYSGSVPRVDNKEVMSNKEFLLFKKEIQDDFKNNKFSLLVSTKAFGMGINKGNINYTFHYGIPSSLESLYQEAGRAGREKTKFSEKKAKCHILFTKTEDKGILEKLWKRETSLEEIKVLSKSIKGDINKNLYFFIEGNEVIGKESKEIFEFYEKHAIANEIRIIEGKKIGISREKTEKIIYRLFQLGVVNDWTISNHFGGGTFEVEFSDFSEKTIQSSLLYTINKHDKEFSIDAVLTEEKYKTYANVVNNENINYIEKFIQLLLMWSYDNFSYNRKQSLKNIYENCCDLADGKLDSSKFKQRIENYFRVTNSSFILQHIAENPNDIKSWFKVFYEEQNLHQFISSDQQEKLRDNLSRFLESYMYNTGLDFVSGLIRLILGDYDNNDGKIRMESSLEKIKEYSKKDFDYVIKELIKIGENLDDNSKSLLSESIYKVVKDESLLFSLAECMKDSYSIKTCINLYNNRLKKVQRRLV